jgi:hypothetical protein
MHAEKGTGTDTGRREAARTVIAGYARLRPAGAAWRSRLGRLLSPLLRLHHYRDVSTQMWRKAIANRDCRDRTELTEGGCR